MGLIKFWLFFLGLRLRPVGDTAAPPIVLAWVPSRKGERSEIRKPYFKSQLCHLPVACVMATYLTFPDVRLLFCEAGVTVSMQTSQRAVHAQLGRGARLKPVHQVVTLGCVFVLPLTPPPGPLGDGSLNAVSFGWGHLRASQLLLQGNVLFTRLCPVWPWASLTFTRTQLPSGYCSGVASSRRLQVLRAGGVVRGFLCAGQVIRAWAPAQPSSGD